MNLFVFYVSMYVQIFFYCFKSKTVWILKVNTNR